MDRPQGLLVARHGHPLTTSYPNTAAEREMMNLADILSKGPNKEHECKPSLQIQHMTMHNLRDTSTNDFDNIRCSLNSINLPLGSIEECFDRDDQEWGWGGKDEWRGPREVVLSL
jgi:hypothetical protein